MSLQACPKMKRKIVKEMESRVITRRGGHWEMQSGQKGTLLMPRRITGMSAAALPHSLNQSHICDVQKEAQEVIMAVFHMRISVHLKW